MLNGGFRVRVARRRGKAKARVFTHLPRRKMTPRAGRLNNDIAFYPLDMEMILNSMQLKGGIL
jgi:hypothetical protein